MHKYTLLEIIHVRKYIIPNNITYKCASRSVLPIIPIYVTSNTDMHDVKKNYRNLSCSSTLIVSTNFVEFIEFLKKRNKKNYNYIIYLFSI